MLSLLTNSALSAYLIIVVGLLSLFALIIVINRTYSVYTNPLCRLPGPAISKWTHLRLQIAALRGNKMTYIHELHRRYGPVVRISPREVALSDKSAVRTIYKTGSPYLKTQWYRNFVGDTGNRTELSLFSNPDRKAHSDHRRIVAANFSERWVKKLEPYIAKTIRLSVERMAEEHKTQGYTDAFKWWTFMATDVIGEASFGESFKTVEFGKETQYMEDIKRAGRNGILRAEFPTFMNLISKLPIPIKGLRDVEGAIVRTLGYGENMIERYWNQLRTDPENVKPTLLTPEYAQVEAGVMTAAQLRRDATGYIVAGTDTTALAATYAVWLLSQNSDVEQELIHEVSAVSDAFTDEDIKDLPVLNGVIKETLRLRSPISQGLPRCVPPSGAEFDGWFVPGGVTVGIQAWTMHRDPTVYEDPEVFKPSRWNEPTRDMKDCFLPFGSGSRVCIGQHFAQLELRHALTNFYKVFNTGVKASRAEGFAARDMEPVSWFMMPPKGGRCLLERR